MLTPSRALAAPMEAATTIENANVKLVLTPTSAPAGDQWALGERMTFNLQLTNKTNTARGFKIRSTNFDFTETNNNTAAGCKWQSAQPNQLNACNGKLSHTVTETDIAAGGFTPSLVYDMYSSTGYNGAAVLAGGFNIPINSTITLTNPKEGNAPWRVGERMTFSISLTNNTGIQRAFEPAQTNLTGTAGCRWRVFENGATKNCNNISIYHDVTAEDLAAGSFTPSLTWKMYPGTEYSGAAENFAPTVAAALPVVEVLKLISFEQTPDSTKDKYNSSDELVFTVTIQNTGREAVSVEPVSEGSNVLFADGCANTSLAPQANHSCTVRYTLTDQDLVQGRVNLAAVLRALGTGGVEQDRLVARKNNHPTPGTFDPASAFSPYDADPTAAAAISDMRVIAQNDAINAIRIPAIAVAQNGDVLVSYDARPKAGRSNGGDSPNENSIIQRRSTDGGKTWQPATVIAEGKLASDGWGYSDPSYVVDYETGRIFNFHVYSFDAGFSAGRYSLAADGNVDETHRSTMNFGLSISDDNGYTWRKEVITHQVLKGKVPGALSCFATSGAGTQKRQAPHKGRLLQQAACRVQHGNGEAIRAFTIYSDDHGATWHGGDFTTVEVAGLGALRFDENKVVELSDGSLMLNSRTWTGENGPRYRITAISRDGGQTWGDYQTRAELVDPANNAQIIRAFPNAKPGSLRSKVLLFSNTNNPNSRTNGTISLSCDDGATWPVRREFRAGGTGYTTMAVQEDGTIGLLMEPNGGGWIDIGYQNFTLSWVAPQGLCSEVRSAVTGVKKVQAGKAIEPFALFEHNDPMLADTVTVEGLPQGLMYNEATGKVEGTPTAEVVTPTDYQVTATIQEAEDGTRYERIAHADFTIKVMPVGGRTWYVAADGDDANDGLSPEHPFQTLNPVNDLELLPGDAVYLRRGDVFNDQFLHLKGAGSAAKPIKISAYGDAEDPLPVINTNGEGQWQQNYNTALDNTKHKNQGTVSSSILLKDVPYIEVSNLEITNIRQADQPQILRSKDAMDRTGVAVIAENAGTINHVVLKNLYIHDVDGNVYNKHMANGGIYVIAHKPLNESATGVARFNDIQVLNNRVEDVSRWGIGVGYTGYTSQFRGGSISEAAMHKYGQTNVLVRGNYVKGAGGDAITVFYALRPLVEYNVSVDASKYINTADYPDDNFGRVAAGIWPWKTKNAVFQYNEAYNTLNGAHGNGDGMPWDSDWSDGTLYQYNYSAANTGGTYMICGSEAVNSTFRYNISQNDVGGLLDPVDSNPNGHIYNNTFYIAPDVPILKTDHNARGNVTIENNIFYYTGNTPRQENWSRGDTASFVKRWKHNLYYNYANKPATDTEAVQVSAGTPVFAGETIKLAPQTARPDFLTYRLPEQDAAASAPRRAPGITREANDADPFGGYRLADGSPAADAGKAITDENGFAPEADFFGTPLAGVTDMGAVQYRSADERSSAKELLSTIYLLTNGADGARTLHVPQTQNNPTPVSEVVANVKVSPFATPSIVNADGSAVAADQPLAEGMKLRITAEDGSHSDIPLAITNTYSWVDNYVNNQQGNVWFGQRQMDTGGEWLNIDQYDPNWPIWLVDGWYGPGLTGSKDIPPVGQRDAIRGLISDSPDTASDSTAMAFRAPKTGAVTFTVKDDEPQLRQSPNTGGTVVLSLYKNGEELQSVELSQSLSVAQAWNDFTADNPILVEQGDYLRVVAHSVDRPTKPSLWISPVIEYIDVTPDPVAVTPVEPVWDDEAGLFVTPDIEGVVYRIGDRVLVAGESVDGLAGTRVIVTVSAADGFVLADGSPNEFTHEFPAAPEPPTPSTEVSAIAPNATDPADCDVPPFVTIPMTTGVQYLIDGKPVVAGDYEYRYGQTVTVTAEPKDGFVLAPDADRLWTFSADLPAGCGEQPGTDEPGTDTPGTDTPGTDEPEQPGNDEPQQPGGTDKPAQPETPTPGASQQLQLPLLPQLPAQSDPILATSDPLPDTGSRNTMIVTAVALSLMFLGFAAVRSSSRRAKGLRRK
ncbi:MAG: sialidase family protein [Actinomycetaceae bacterium]|nr:sialidase family protein [Actinomycetaceae bacterium]MDY5855326.1 sialidase family protein [Arcanobacterium sp.]